MAVVYYQFIDYPGIRDLLIQKGYVRPMTLHPYSDESYECSFDAVLDYAKCDAARFMEEKKKAIEHGIIQFNMKNEDGTYGVRRDLTKREISELGFFPVTFSDNGDSVMWSTRYGINTAPAHYISAVIGDEKVYTMIECEGDILYEGYMRNGEVDSKIESQPAEESIDIPEQMPATTKPASKKCIFCKICRMKRKLFKKKHKPANWDEEVPF